MTKTKKFTYIIAVIVAAITFILSSFVVGSGVVAHAATSATAEFEITTFMDDLRKDSTFSESDYPAIEDNYSLQVMQVAESSDGELLIYVYQPSAKTKTLTATSINISTAINDNLKYQNYRLTLLGASGVFAKYLVEDFTVKSDVVRYYDISSIFRAYDSGIDSPASGGNLISEVSYEVAQLWTACTLNGTVTYEMIQDEVITIADKYVGYLRYPDGFKLLAGESCDSWYVAFSADYDIDKLYEADIAYVEKDRVQSGTMNPLTNEITITSDNYLEARTAQKKLTYEDIANNDGSGWLAKKFIWNRIESVTDFIKNEDLKDEIKSELQGKQWVLRFTETDFNVESSPGFPNPFEFSITMESTEVTDVTILRLKFETAGTVYNLGVVDNKQYKEPGASPDNKVGYGFGNRSLLDTIGIIVGVILGLIALVVILVFLWPIISPVVTAIVKGLIWLITAPFKAISTLFNKKE